MTCRLEPAAARIAYFPSGGVVDSNIRFWRAWLCLFVKVSIPDTGKGKKQGTLSKKYPLYGKSRTDDVMKTPS